MRFLSFSRCMTVVYFVSFKEKQNEKRTKKAVFYGIVATIALVAGFKNHNCFFLSLILYCIMLIYILIHKKHCKEGRFIYNNPVETKAKAVVKQALMKKKEEKSRKSVYKQSYDDVMRRYGKISGALN